MLLFQRRKRDNLNKLALKAKPTNTDAPRLSGFNFFFDLLSCKARQTFSAGFSFAGNYLNEWPLHNLLLRLYSSNRPCNFRQRICSLDEQSHNHEKGQQSKKSRHIYVNADRIIYYIPDCNRSRVRFSDTRLIASGVGIDNHKKHDPEQLACQQLR